MVDWKKVKGFENYSVSRSGIVYNDKSNAVHNDKRGKVLSVRVNDHGYVSYALWSNKGFKKIFRVNLLVAQAFIPNPLGLNNVRHKNENKFNNWDWNLEWF